MQDTRYVYVDRLMDFWRMAEQPRRLQRSVRRVLVELVAEGRAILMIHPKLQVMVLPEAPFSVWAYFPIHRRRTIAKKLRPKSQTRVLLVFGTRQFNQERVKDFEDHLRDHLGHVLLYLRAPKARNDCPDAQKEWREWRRSITPTPSRRRGPCRRDSR